MADLGNQKIKDTYQLVLQTDPSGNLQKLDGSTPNPFIINQNLRYLDGSTHPSGYVLVSDGSGNASWGAVAFSGDVYISGGSIEGTTIQLQTTSGNTISIPGLSWSSSTSGDISNSGLTGNVGIGTSTPNTKLTVLGGVSGSTHLYAGDIQINSSGYVLKGSDNRMFFPVTDNSSTPNILYGFWGMQDNGHFYWGNDKDLDIYHSGSQAYIDNDTGTLNILSATVKLGDTTSETIVNDNLQVTDDLTVNANNLYVDSSNQRVGVGTLAPDAILTISGNSFTAFTSFNLNGGTATFRNGQDRVLFAGGATTTGISPGDEIKVTDGNGDLYTVGVLTVPDSNNIFLTTNFSGEDIEATEFTYNGETPDSEFLKIYDSTTPVFQVSGSTVASGSTDLLGIFVPSAGYPDVTGSMNITGNLGVSGTVITPNVTATTITAGSDIIIGNGRYIGSTSDTDAIQIESDGDVVLSQGLTVSQITNFLSAARLGDATKIQFGASQDAELYVSGDDFYIDQTTSNKDIIFKGTDDGSDITALTLDMSDAGTALFNSKVTIGTTVPDKTLTVSGTITASTSISTPILSSTTLTVDGGVDISGNTIIGGSNFVSGDTHSDNIVLKANAGGTSFGQITPDVNHGTIKFMTKPPGTADNGESLTISQDLIEAKAAPNTNTPVSYMKLQPVDGGQDVISFNDSNNDIDFLIKSDNQIAFKLDAANDMMAFRDHVGISDSADKWPTDTGGIGGTPTYQLRVAGKTLFSGETSVYESFSAGTLTLAYDLNVSGDTTVGGDISGTTDLYLGGTSHTASTITAENKLTIKGAESTNDYISLENDYIHLFVDGASAVVVQNTPGDGMIVLNASNKDMDTKIVTDDGTNAIHVDAGLNLVRIRDKALIGPGTPTDYTQSLYVSGSSLFYSGGTNNSNNAIDAVGDISGNTNLYIDRDVTVGGSIKGSDIIVDAEGDITLDANGADIVLSDDGTDFGRFKRDTSNFVIKSETNNKDIIFKGVDDSSTITALTLDMSEAGKATFNSNVISANEDVYMFSNRGQGQTNADNWYGPNYQGIWNYSWSKDYGDTEAVKTLEEDYINAGLLVPYDCVLTGFFSIGHTNTGTAGYGCGLWYITQSNLAASLNVTSGQANDATLIMGVSGETVDPGSGKNPLTIDKRGTVNITLAAGSMIYPRVGRSAVVTDTTWNIYLKRT